MSNQSLNEHFACYNHDPLERPQIEVANIPSGQIGESTIVDNMIIFFVEGRVRFTYHDFSDHDGVTGKFVLLPAGKKYSVTTLSDACLVVFKLSKMISLCENFITYRSSTQSEEMYDSDSTTEKSLSMLEIKPPIRYFLKGVSNYIEDEVICRCFLNLKVKELLFLMRAYYTKEQLSDFFSPILSADAVFSEHVLSKWDQFSSIHELAKSMQLTSRQFSTRFSRVFGRRPNRWMMEARAEKIFTEITSTQKSFKQIAVENMFHSEVYFTKFCKSMLGATPSLIRTGEHGCAKKPID